MKENRRCSFIRKSDIIRDELLNKGWQIEDTEAGAVIKKIK